MSADERRRAGRPDQPRVVGLGGGHGLAASLAALRRLTDDVTAIVGVADDGGSSRAAAPRARRAAPRRPADGPGGTVRRRRVGTHLEQAVQHRFGGDGELSGHAVGNLLISALWEETGDVVGGLKWVAELLGVHGRVLPVALTTPMAIVADVLGLFPDRPHEVVELGGQVQVATTPGDVLRLRIDPADPPACPEAVAAISSAHALVIGPGRGSRRSSRTSSCRASRMQWPRRLPVASSCSTSPHSRARPAGSLLRRTSRRSDQFPGLGLDIVLADPDHAPDLDALTDACREVGARVALQRIAAPVDADGTSARHDPDLLAAAFRSVLGGAPSSGSIDSWR